MHYDDAIIEVLEDDGQLRDIQVPISSAHDYIKLVDSLPELRFRSFTELGGSPSTPDDCIRQFLLGDDMVTGCTKIYVADVQINLWYLSEKEIEMDFLPSDVNSKEKWDAIISLMRHIAMVFSVEIGIYHEGDHESAMCKVRG